MFRVKLLCMFSFSPFCYSSKFLPLFSFSYSLSIFLFQIWFSLERPSRPIQSISRFVRPSVRLSVCVSVCLSVCLFTFEVPFNGLFAPTSRSRMSNIFRDSESLEKSNGKKWSHIWTFLFENCQKSPRKKKFFFADFAGLFQWGGFITTWGSYIEIWSGYIGMMRVLGYSWSTLQWHRCYYPHRSRDSVSPVCGIFRSGCQVRLRKNSITKKKVFFYFLFSLPLPLLS